MNESVLSRLPGLLFAVVVITVIAALLAGYGIPVGVGAVAGFVLGGIAGLLSVLWIARGSGRSITVGGTSWSGSRSGHAPQEEDFAELRAMSELAEIDLGPVLSVDPVIQTQGAGGLTVELASVSVHSAGLRFDLEVRPNAGEADPGHLARVTVNDDLGTSYRAAGQRSGGSRVARYEVRSVPRPPAGVSSLQVRIDSFADPFPGGGRRAGGPWAFSVSLGSAKRA